MFDINFILRIAVPAILILSGTPILFDGFKSNNIGEISIGFSMILMGFVAHMYWVKKKHD
jgi:hypothetical protein